MTWMDRVELGSQVVIKGARVLILLLLSPVWVPLWVIGSIATKCGVELEEHYSD